MVGARAIASMAERYERPAWVRRVNAMATAVGDARRIVPIDAAELVGLAQKSLGGGAAGDFGDPDWRARFERLAAALDAARMHVVGRLLTREELLRCLRTRLLLAGELERKPAIASERIEAPLIVTGPARSGTTILFELLWLDPDLRGPTAFEALHPLPLPESGGEDARLAASECEQELWADVQPEFAAIHELRSDLPVECVTLTAPCFCGPHWSMVAQLEGFLPDMEEMYRFHRRILQVLQHGRPRRTWLLKTPGHLMTLGLLHATYPDAWIVQTHRDPAKTMPSTVSTTAMVQWLRSDHVELPPLAATIEGVFAFALNNVAAERRAGTSPLRFVDVHFQDLMRDPVETLRRAYAAMGRDFGSAHAERIRRYLAEKPKGKFGTHRYSPEDWGFTTAGLREHLAPYIEYFGVALED
ncbi:MAG TPA: sulfotransferase [Myxococcota bacterium]|nr:sulfotransferase [Myxococcota bacterium]